MPILIFSPFFLFALVENSDANIGRISFDENILPGEKAYYLTPKGKMFNQKIAKKLSREKVLNLI